MRCPIYSCQLVRQKSVQYNAPSRLNSTANAKRVVAELVRPLLENSPVEQFLVISVDTKLKPIGIHPITVGTLDASLVHPREVFIPAILANASAIFICHNHPSGDLTPSPQDREVTKRLEQVGEVLGIRVVDHIIVGFDNDKPEPWQSLSLQES